MDQEILLSMCKTLVASDKDNAIEALKKMIEDYKEVITDKKAFYVELINALATTPLTVIKVIDNGNTKERLNEVSRKKFCYLEELIFGNLEEKDAIKESLSFLCQYNDPKVVELFIKLLNIPKCKDFAIGCLSNMETYYRNITLVRFVVENKLFNKEMLNSLALKIGNINFQTEITINNFNKCDDEIKKEKIQKKIKKLKKEYNYLAQLIIKIFTCLGKSIKPTNEFFKHFICQNKELNQYFINYLIQIDNYDNTDLNFVLLADNLSLSESYDLVRLLINKRKLLKEDLGDLIYINEIIEKLFLDISKRIPLKEQEEQFLEDVLNSHAIYNLDAKNLVTIVEYLYAQRELIPSSSVIAYREEYEQDEEYNPNDNGKLETEMYYVVKPLAEAGHSKKYFFEQLLLELLKSKYSHKYEKSILRILNGDGYVDMKYNTPNDYHDVLLYAICAYGTDEVIKATLKKYELPTYMFCDFGGTDLFKVYTRLGEYDKALTIFNNERYELVNPGEEYCLNDSGQYDIEEVESYVDELSEIIQLLCHRKDKKGVDFLNQILYSPKLTIINVEALEKLKFLYSDVLNMEQEEVDTLLNQISEYFKERLRNKELKMFVVKTDTNTSLYRFTGLRLATTAEIKKAFDSLKTSSKVKKLVPLKYISEPKSIE